MRSRLLISIALCVAVCPVFGQSDNAVTKQYEWDKVIPLVTTKGQVEEYFGRPLDETPLVVATYSAKFGKITVWYKGAKDPPGWICKWDLPQDTVINYFVSLVETIPVAEFGRDPSQFERSVTHVGTVAYTNKQTGLSFIADATGKNGELINAIQVSPPQKEIECFCTKTN